MDGIHFPVPVVPILTRFRVFCVSFWCFPVSQTRFRVFLVSFGCFPVSQTRFRIFCVSFGCFPVLQTRFRVFRVSFGCFPVLQTRFCVFRVSFGSPGCKYTEYLRWVDIYGDVTVVSVFLFETLDGTPDFLLVPCQIPVFGETYSEHLYMLVCNLAD